MKKKFKHFENLYGITFVTTSPYMFYYLYKNKKLLHTGTVVNPQESEIKVRECAIEWITNYTR